MGNKFDYGRAIRFSPCLTTWMFPVQLSPLRLYPGRPVYFWLTTEAQLLFTREVAQ